MPSEGPHTKTRVALVADLFYGAGGSSAGARRVLGRLGFQMKLVAVNHWNVAIETHSRNHPEARHYCQDVNTVKPTEVVPEGKLDLLMASPTCTYHSRARGGKPINDQGRMDPWAIVHWCTELRVRRLLVENVPEFVDWGPLDLRTGRPIKRRRGEYFRAWTAALQGAGFKLDWRVLNTADFGDATTRERFFLMARSDGKRVHWPDPTHSRAGEADLLGHGRHKWRAAREIIDWSIEGRSIFDRKRPLSRKTLARIYAGGVKFRWPAPFLVILRNHMDAQSLDEPLPTVYAGGTHIGLAQPFLLNRHGENGSTRARPRRAHADRGLPRRGLSLRALCGEPRSRRCRRKPLPHDRGTAADAARGRRVSCPRRALYHVGPDRRRTARDQRSDAGHDRPTRICADRSVLW